MKVEVYWNLHRKGYSIRALEGKDKGRVINKGHPAAQVLLRDAVFVVQPTGSRKVKETGVKNVHAFVRGEWEEAMPPTTHWLEYTFGKDSGTCEVKYDPKKDVCWWAGKGREYRPRGHRYGVKSAKWVWLNSTTPQPLQCHDPHSRRAIVTAYLAERGERVLRHA